MLVLALILILAAAAATTTTTTTNYYYYYYYYYYSHSHFDFCSGSYPYVFSYSYSYYYYYYCYYCCTFHLLLLQEKCQHLFLYGHSRNKLVDEGLSKYKVKGGKGFSGEFRTVGKRLQDQYHLLKTLQATGVAKSEKSHPLAKPPAFLTLFQPSGVP